MKRFKFIGLGVLALIIGSVIIAYSLNQEEKPDTEKPKAPSTEPKGAIILRKNLQIIPVQIENRTIRVPITGRVIPKNRTDIFAEVQGRILSGSKTFKEGVTFRRGETLLQIDFKEFSLNLESQKSAFFNTLTGMMPDLKADYPDNYQNWLQYIQNYQTGETLKPLPTTQSEGEKYFVTSNQVYSAYYAIKAQEERLRKYTISAPYNCMLTEARVDVGGLVSPGQSLGTIINIDQYELQAGVPLAVAALLKVGDQVSFQSNEIEGNWTGTVTRVNNLIDAKTQNVPVYFLVNGPSVKSGLYLEGSFGTKSYEHIFCVHNSTLTRDNQVRILQKEVIVNKPVQPVAYLRDSVLVKGLENGDQLILNQFDMPVVGKKVMQ